jgi:hypothetical protein
MYCLQAQEHADHVFGAQYDDVRERYHAERLDMEMYDASEREHYEYMWKVEQAGFGDDYEAYEAEWKRTIEYYENQGLQDV